MASSDFETVLKAEGISKTFGVIRALDQVDLEVKKGSVHAVIGHNGAGKSTLMNIVSGVHKPDSGRLLLDGKALSFNSPRDALDQGISMVHQELSIIPDLDVGENIFVGREPTARLNLVDRRKLYESAERLLTELKFDVSARTLCSTLSVGTRQMIEIARAISLDSKILILDEPTSALTSHEQQRLFGLINRLKQRGIGILYVSHRLGEVRELADTITVLRDGRRVSTMPAREVSHDALVEMMMGHPVRESETFAPSSQGALGLEVVGLSSKSAGLEEINLSAQEGEIVGLAGMLGSGRTELFDCLFGLRPFENGTIRVRGHEVRPRSPVEAMQAGIALVPEDRRAQGIFAGVSVWKNAAFASVHDIFHAALGFVREKRARRSVREEVDRFNIKARSLNEEIQFLSGGNQQKVILTRWLMRRPFILLLDDPTAGIDVGAKSEIHAHIGRLAQRGVTVFMSSSEFPELLHLCHRILVIREGRIVREVDPTSVSEALLVAAATGSEVGKSSNGLKTEGHERIEPA